MAAIADAHCHFQKCLVSSSSSCCLGCGGCLGCQLLLLLLLQQQQQLLLFVRCLSYNKAIT
jgi:hypothetical protein